MNKQKSNEKQIKELLDDVANKAMFNFVIVMIALMALLFFHLPILYYSIGLNNLSLTVFFFCLVSFFIYTGFLLFSNLTYTKFIIYLIWVIALFSANIIVKDIRMVSSINICLEHGGDWNYNSSFCEMPKIKNNIKQ